MTRTEEVYSGYLRSRRKRRAWAADNPGNAAIRRELLTAVLEIAAPELGGSGRVLDLGCGTGWWLRSLAGAGVEPARLEGVEVLPARVGAAREAVPGARIRLGDIRKLETEGDFALVLLFTVLSSLPSAAEVRTALGEARRALAPGGLLLVYEPRVANPLNRHTRRLSDGDLDAAGLEPRTQRSLTLVPALARRLGARTEARYQRLSRLAPLRTHRLIAYRAPAQD